MTAGTGTCWYCARDGQAVEPCCARHSGPHDLVCADRQGCRDFILAGLQDAAIRTSPPGTESGDVRIGRAREYLDGARARKVATLPPSVLMRELAETRRQLGQVLDVADELAAADPVGCGFCDTDTGTEPYCTTCGEWAGMFLGLEGWHHFRGDPAPGGVRTLYDADHEAVIGWIEPPGHALSPAGQATLRQALADAVWHQAQRGTGSQAAAYIVVARALGIEVPR